MFGNIKVSQAFSKNIKLEIVVFCLYLPFINLLRRICDGSGQEQPQKGVPMEKING